ncbi:MAG: hypothetical protein JWO94_1858 [Verrucomicrobiaceae bacterium]|nr:hypothetical protein [Verrucomicrobiaceae bacterium]
MFVGLMITLLLALTTGIGFIVSGRLAHHRRKTVECLQAEREAIVVEERRMFSFLHELGIAIANENRQSSLHKFIVEGAIKVTCSEGGVFYAYDEGKNALVPRYHSEFGAPLIELTESVLAQAESNPSSLLSVLRRQSVAADASMLGHIFERQKPEYVANLAEHADMGGQANPYQKGITLMAGPVTSGGRKLGVLVVTARAADRKYSANDFEVFSSLVEQSAFALANATAHQEVQTKRQLEAELQTAGDVQRFLLPETDPELDGFVIVGRNRPARILSGDFYDYVQCGPQHFGAVIADVSGKGLPAALVAATCRSALQAHAAKDLSPSAVLSAVNRQMFDDIREDMFVSMIYMIFALGGSKVTLSRAGHPNPFLWRKRSGEVEEVISPGLGVGIDQGAVFDRVAKDHTLTMETGDCLLLYTDGVNEALDAEGEEYSDDRIKRVLAAAAPGGATAVLDSIMEELNTLTGGKASHDDVTLIVLQKT